MLLALLGVVDNTSEHDLNWGAKPSDWKPEQLAENLSKCPHPYLVYIQDSSGKQGDSYSFCHNSQSGSGTVGELALVKKQAVVA